jgi:hypothetical protein
MPGDQRQEAFMIRFAIAALLLLALSACHTTDLGRSVGWPTPQRISR